ncbi:hypothetical protein Tco_0558049 [Tanacetum coccineum]
MAQLKYCDKHNQVGFLKKPNESAGFEQIVDFLRGSNLRYALTHNPTIYDSLVKQFWQTASVITLADETQEIKATIDSREYTITEASIRTQLQLADALGTFTPPWRFLVHHILHCLSSKSGGWDQFGSNIAVAMICLSTGQVFNFSKLIFYGMLSNIQSRTKFLMYPRFLQMILDIEPANRHLYLATSIKKKVFANMRRGFRGVPRPLLPAMLAAVQEAAGEDHDAEEAEREIQGEEQGEPSAAHVAPTPVVPSSPPPTTTISPSPPPSQPSMSTPPTTSSIPSTSHTAPASEPAMEHTYTTPSPQPFQATCSFSVEDLCQLVPQLMERIDHLEKDLKDTKQTFGTTILTLVKKVKDLETGLKRKSKKVVLSDSDDEDFETQGRKTQVDESLHSPIRETSKPSGEAQERDLSPTTLEAAQILSKVASQKPEPKAVKKYIRRKVLPGKIKFQEVTTTFEVSTAIGVSTGAVVSTGAEVSTGQAVNTGSIGISTASAPVNTGSISVSTASVLVSTGVEAVSTDSTRVSIPSPPRPRREGKAQMTEEDEPTPKKTKLQIQQEKASLAEALRLQQFDDEERAKQIHLDSLYAQRLAEEQELSE